LYENDEIQKKSKINPKVICHKNLPKRFDRYLITNGYNSIINSVQFKNKIQFPKNFTKPHELYNGEKKLVLEDLTIELYHAKGETGNYNLIKMMQLGYIYQNIM
jgi:hypothetical protein